MNKAVHYNEWANFGKKDFQPVVAAFKDLAGCFQCDKCESYSATGGACLKRCGAIAVPLV